VVVDNGSTDGSADVVARWRRPATVIRLADNRGFGAACNIGVRRARHPAVVLLNPDTLLVDDSLPALAEFALMTGSLCGPALLDTHGHRQPSASPPPGGWEVIVEAVLPAVVLPTRVRVRAEPWRSARAVEVGWLTGACLAAPRETLLRLGPFDERIHLYGEDMELGLRAREQSVPSMFAPDVARVVHAGGRSASRRFADGGAAAKLRARREVVAERRGLGRARLDFGTQVAFHASRYVAKRALRRDARREQTWLKAWRAGPCTLEEVGRARRDSRAHPADREQHADEARVAAGSSGPQGLRLTRGFLPWPKG
jgi:N-acetylglucosaminyl-diphospho-decaprenol L-rhamnosyltransferase